MGRKKSLFLISVTSSICLILLSHWSPGFIFPLFGRTADCLESLGHRDFRRDILAIFAQLAMEKTGCMNLAVPPLIMWEMGSRDKEQKVTKEGEILWAGQATAVMFTVSPHTHFAFSTFSNFCFSPHPLLLLPPTVFKVLTSYKLTDPLIHAWRKMLFTDDEFTCPRPFHQRFRAHPQ